MTSLMTTYLPIFFNIIHPFPVYLVTCLGKSVILEIAIYLSLELYYYYYLSSLIVESDC